MPSPAVSPQVPEPSSLSAALRAAQARHTLFPHLPPVTGDEDVSIMQPIVQPVVVGVSGGADSVGLLYALHALQDAWRLALHVAHLDHSLRADSGDDAAWVAQLADRLGLPYHGARLEPDAQRGPGGLEDTARQRRYEFLCRVARTITPSRQTPIVAVAHHRDDQAETVLMHFIQGSGLDGLAGMAPVSEVRAPRAAPPIRLIRPLLDVSRAQIRAYLKREGIAWREDATNRDESFLRNRLRHTILPALAAINPQIGPTLARTAHVLAGDAARLAALDRQTLAHLLCQVAPALPVDELQARRVARRIVLDLDGLLALEIAARRGVLRQALACFDVHLRELGADHIETLLASATAPRGPGPHPLPGKLAWTYFPPAAEQPARLSLHAAHVLPWQPDHPHIPISIGPVSIGAERQSRPIPTPGAARIDQQWVLRTRVLPIEQLPAGWRAGVSAWEAYLDAERVGGVRLTTPAAGMRIAPLGMGGHTKSVGDLFTDAKIHPTLRGGWPVVTGYVTGSQEWTVLWVCGLTVSEAAHITDATQRALHLAWRDAA